MGITRKEQQATQPEHARSLPNSSSFGQWVILQPSCSLEVNYKVVVVAAPVAVSLYEFPRASIAHLVLSQLGEKKVSKSGSMS
jgi:hypothetical protein